MTTRRQATTRIPTLLGLLMLTTSIACVEASFDDQPDAADALYHDLADLQYMHALLEEKDTHTIYLDLSDPRQYDFVLGRLSASDKNLETSPGLLRRLQEVRERHSTEKARFTAPNTAPPAELAADHFISSFQADSTTSIFEATAFSAVRGGSDYSFLDVRVYSTDHRLLAADFAEEYMAGGQLVARGFGNEPKSPYRVIVDSIEYVRKGNHEYVSYSRVLTTNLNESEISRPGTSRDKTLECDQDNTFLAWPDPTLGSSSYPGSDSTVTICLYRTGADCDYHYPNNTGYVPMPFKGQMQFTGDTIANYSTLANKTFAKISNTTDGVMVYNNFTGQHPDGTSVIQFIYDNSFNRVGVQWSVGDGTIRNQSSNLNGARFTNANGSGIPFARRENVNFHVQVAVNPTTGTNTDVTGLISSVASDMTSDCQFTTAPQVNIYYGCLAEGTQIRMADGSLSAIENIDEDAAVIADESGMVFDVADLSVGVEEKSMVRIRDDQGRDLLLTESHPIVTADQGILWASELEVGDMVMTESGPSELLYVGRELYRGKVHNLRLDKGADPAANIEQGGTLYANGFLVGDLAMQRAYEFKNADAERAALLEALPLEWHADYQYSQTRKDEESDR